MSPERELPVYEIYRAQSPIVVDGRMDEPAWKAAPEVELKLNSDGGAPLWGTRARMLYDDQWLYVGFLSRDPHIWGTLTGHDDPIYNEEVVEIFLDPIGRGTIYYELEVNPLNTSFDAVILNDAPVSGSEGRGERFQGFTGWNPGSFKHAVTIQEGRLNDPSSGPGLWCCEMAIRFADMFLGANVPPRPGDQWRGNLFRIDIDGDKSEESSFSPTGRPDFHVPARFGRFIFR
ncbi:carbohydrate-binding family 9-like protein [bacterium]|nr:carbohydrate-binding family 9-like protein [bacterium]